MSGVCKAGAVGKTTEKKQDVLLSGGIKTWNEASCGERENKKVE